MYLAILNNVRFLTVDRNKPVIFPSHLSQLPLPYRSVMIQCGSSWQQQRKEHRASFEASLS